MFFEQVSKRQDDKELLALDRDEIITLSSGCFPVGSSAEGSAGSSMVKLMRTTGSRSSGNTSSVGHVQARVWAGQVIELSPDMGF